LKFVEFVYTKLKEEVRVGSFFLKNISKGYVSICNMALEGNIDCGVALRDVLL